MILESFLFSLVSFFVDNEVRSPCNKVGGCQYSLTGVVPSTPDNLELDSRSVGELVRAGERGSTGSVAIFDLSR